MTTRRFISLLLLGVILLEAGRGNYVRGQESSKKADARSTLAGLLDQRRKLDKTYADRLEALAQRAIEVELPDQAKATRAWIVPRDPRKSYFFQPNAADPTKPPADAPQVVQQWHAKLLRVRADRAEELFQLARQAVTEQHPALAYQLLHEALREHPEHEAARRIVDDAQAAGAKGGKPKAPTSSTPKSDHTRLGWARGKYWQIDSEHFRIMTNHSAAAGIDLARRLEVFHAVWRQAFFEIWSSSEALAARFEGRDEPLGRRRVHEVILFKNREEYVEALRSGEPKIGVTTGIYLDKQRAAYFYSADELVHPSWYHEVSHQLFQEMLDAPDGAGTDANMWALEAVALYCESFSRREGFSTLGGLDAPRLQFARYYALRDAFRMPLAELVTLNRSRLQEHPQIRQIYSQSAGYSHFFLDQPDQRHRAAFVRYLQAIYGRRDTRGSLVELLQLPLPEIDRQYIGFLQVNDADLAALDLLPKPRQLSLGRTAVTDTGLARIAADCTRLEWLDLSFTKVTDRGWRAFQGAGKLRQLFVERTALTDAAVAQISSCRDLEELDLSHTKVTDAGLVHLASLKKLRQLYLAGCPITDQGIAALKSLKQLETLDLDETQVSAAGRAELKRALPKWKPED